MLNSMSLHLNTDEYSLSIYDEGQDLRHAPVAKFNLLSANEERLQPKVVQSVSLPTDGKPGTLKWLYRYTQMLYVVTTICTELMDYSDAYAEAIIDNPKTLISAIEVEVEDIQEPTRDGDVQFQLFVDGVQREVKDF